MLGFGIVVPSPQPQLGDVLSKTYLRELLEVKSTRKLVAPFVAFKINFSVKQALHLAIHAFC